MSVELSPKERAVKDTHEAYLNTLSLQKEGRQELKAIEGEISALEAKKERLREELRRFEGNYGRVSKAKGEWAAAVLTLQAESLPNPIWLQNPPMGDRVITKVTPKRIYVRKPESDRAQHYSRATGWEGSGMAGSWKQRLDVEACLKAWENYKNESEVKL